MISPWPSGSCGQSPLFRLPRSGYALAVRSLCAAVQVRIATTSTRIRVWSTLSARQEQRSRESCPGNSLCRYSQSSPVLCQASARFLKFPDRTTTSSRTEKTTITPITRRWMPTCAPIMFRPFSRVCHTAAPAKVPSKSPVPPRGEIPPMTPAATPYISYMFPASILPMPAWAQRISPTTQAHTALIR